MPDMELEVIRPLLGKGGEEVEDSTFLDNPTPDYGSKKSAWEHLRSCMTRRPVHIATVSTCAFALLISGAILHSGFSARPTGAATGYENDLWLNITQADNSSLWSYIPGLSPNRNTTVDGWEWVRAHRPAGYRRPSWGGLKQQGPRALIRENLKQDAKYLTGTTQAGSSNEFMEICNLIYLAKLTSRIPILPAFWPDPNHAPNSARFVSFTEVYDITALIPALGTPVVAIAELKVGDSWWTPKRYWAGVQYDGETPQELELGEWIAAEYPQADRLECWNTWAPIMGDMGGTIVSFTPADIGWTPLPQDIYDHYPSSSFADLMFKPTAAALNSFAQSGDILPPSSVAQLEKLKLPPSQMTPDDPLTCIDRTYYMHRQGVGLLQDYREGTGVWDEIGRHIRFQPALVRVAMDLVRDCMGLKWGEKVPPYLAIHARRTDFSGEFRNIPHRQWAHEAWTIMEDYKAQTGHSLDRVVFTSDETSPEWIANLTQYGWTHIDHIRVQTEHQLGFWFMPMMDVAILSLGSAFLGKSGSTMSILPYRRVIDWNGGIARFVTSPRDYHVPPDWEWSWPSRSAHDDGVGAGA